MTDVGCSWSVRDITREVDNYLESIAEDGEQLSTRQREELIREVVDDLDGVSCLEASDVYLSASAFLPFVKRRETFEELQVDLNLEGTIKDAISNYLEDGVYLCTRSWEAWKYNTMSEDDFEPVVENKELLDGLTSEVIRGLKTRFDIYRVEAKGKR